MLLKNVLHGIFVSLGAHELLGEALMLFDVCQEVVNHFTLLQLLFQQGLLIQTLLNRFNPLFRMWVLRNYLVLGFGTSPSRSQSWHPLFLTMIRREIIGNTFLLTMCR